MSTNFLGVNHEISVILFDCDGVMCPPLRFAKVLAEQHGITTETTKSFFTDAFTPALLGQVDVGLLLPPYLKDWGWTQSVDDFLDLWLESDRDIDLKMKEIVEEAKDKGLKVGLATNQENRRAKYMRSHMGMADLFDNLFTSCELGTMKPQDSFFRKVADSLSVPSSSILFIVDQLHYIEVANRAGWKTIHFESAEKLHNDLKTGLLRERGLVP